MLVFFKIWKWLLVSFFILSVAVVFTPSPDNESLLSLAHAIISSVVVVLAISLILFPIIFIFRFEKKSGLAKKAIIVILALLFSIMGSLFLYFYFKRQVEKQ